MTRTTIRIVGVLWALGMFYLIWRIAPILAWGLLGTAALIGGAIFLEALREVRQQQARWIELGKQLAARTIDDEVDVEMEEWV